MRHAEVTMATRLAVITTLLLIAACSSRAIGSHNDSPQRESTVDQAPAVGAVLTPNRYSEARAHFEPLPGRIGSSESSAAGWLDLLGVTDFSRGDQLRLTVGGVANQVLIRFLPENADPSDAVGIEGGAIDVPPGRVVYLALGQDHPRTVQISCHGMERPWRLFWLGAGNGVAALRQVEIMIPAR
jgi:hypothetical protein